MNRIHWTDGILVFFTFFLLGTVWAGIMPLWQGPDEPAHFAYIQYMEYHVLAPRQDIVPAGQAPWIFSPSSSEFASIELSQRKRILFDPWSWFSMTQSQRQGALHELARASQTVQSQQAGSQNYVAVYPPLYYQSIALFLRLFVMKNILTAAYAARIITALWLGIFGVLWNAVLGLVTSSRSLRLTTLMTLACSIPTLGMLGGTIGNDIVSVTACMGIFLAAVWGFRHISQLLSKSAAVGFGLVAGLAMWTKEEAYLALFITTPFVIHAVWSHAASPRKRWVWLGIAFSVAMGVSLPWLALTVHRYQSLVVPLTYQSSGLNPRTFGFVFHREFWNLPFEMNLMVTQLFFGMNCPWWKPWDSKPWIHDVLALTACFLLAGGMIASWKKPGWTLAVTWLAIGGATLWTLQWQYDVLTGAYFLQGRYFLFLVCPFSWLFAHFWLRIHKTVRAAFLLGSAIISIATMNHTLWRYYHKSLFSFLDGHIVMLAPISVTDFSRIAVSVLIGLLIGLLYWTMAIRPNRKTKSPAL